MRKLNKAKYCTRHVTKFWSTNWTADEADYCCEKVPVKNIFFQNYNKNSFNKKFLQYETNCFPGPWSNTCTISIERTRTPLGFVLLLSCFVWKYVFPIRIPNVMGTTGSNKLITTRIQNPPPQTGQCWALLTQSS